MSHFLCKLGEIIKRDGENYYSLKCISILDGKKRTYLFQMLGSHFEENTLYLIDVEEQECTSITEINSWHSFNNNVLVPYSNNKDKSDAYEKCAVFLQEIADTSTPFENSIISKILRYNDGDDLELFQCDLLTAVVRSKKNIGWALDEAKRLFAPELNECSYFIDIEEEVFEVLKSNPKNRELWEEAVQHDPTIVELANSQKEKELFISCTPICQMDFILSKKEYSELYSREDFMKLHNSTIRNHAEQLKSFLCDNAVIFDLEGNADAGFAWEYYIRKINNTKGAISSVRKIESNGKYHHIDEIDEWVKFDTLLLSAKIIVGHNIRRHDCVLLKNRSCGNISIDDNKIWDTLEIELLLNPLRDSYAIIVPHSAEKDVLITERLFWTQMRRILSKEDDYLKVRDFLPECIVEYIENNIYQTEKTYLCEAIKIGFENADQFFYSYRHYSCQYLTVQEGSLIVTPKRYWKDLSRIVKNVSFIYNDEFFDYFALLDVDKVRIAFYKSGDAIERALYYLVSELEIKRICLLPDYIINTIGIEKISTLIDNSSNQNTPTIFCTDTYNYINCKQQIPSCIQHVILMDINDGSILDGKEYPGIGQHEQDELYNIVKRKGSYSCYKKRIFIQNNELSNVAKEKDIKDFSFWVFQPNPYSIKLMYSVEPRSIVDSLKEMAHIDISDEEWECENNRDIDIYYATFDRIEYRFPSATEHRKEYWRQQFDIVSNINTDLPKIWILDTNKEVDDVCSYLDFERRKGYHFEAYRTLENASDNSTQICIISWDDIISNKKSLNNNYYFCINDLARYMSMPDIEYEAANVASIVRATIIGINKKLQIFGSGSKLCFIDPILDNFKHILASIFGYDNIIKIQSNVDYEITQGREDRDNSNINELIKWIEKDSNLVYDKNNDIHYTLSEIQKLSIQRYRSYHGPVRNFLTIIPTGGGKSVIFQGPILYDIIHNHCKKLSIVITPLQALMKDQVDEIIGKNSELYEGRVAYIHSGVSSSRQMEIIRKIRKQEISLLYIAPERLLFSHFFKNAILFASLNQGIDSIIFDEAHCITNWGMDFRPSYIFALNKCLELQKRNPEITIQMFTATMSAQSETELRNFIVLPQENIVPRKDSDNIIEQQQYSNALCPIRSHISILIREIKQTNYKDQLRNRVAEMWSLISCNDYLGTQTLMNGRSRAIIFTKSREDARKGAGLLKDIVHGNAIESKIDFFHAKLADKEKEKIADKYKSGETLILFSTKAFGLGMNVKNIHFVGHLSPPSYIEDYLQEVGRVGRDNTLLPAGQKTLKAICLYTKKDLDNIENNNGGLEWVNIAQSFEAIINYLNRIKCLDSRNYYAIPLNLLCRETTFNDLDGEASSQINNTMFMQTLSWLADVKLGRIKLGFLCSDVYELKFNPNRKGLVKGSIVSNLYNYANKIYRENGECDYIVLRANEIISNPIYDVNSPEELDFLIEKCIDCGIFSRDYMYVGVSINDNPFVRNEVFSFLVEHKQLRGLNLLLTMLKTNIEQKDFEDIFSIGYSEFVKTLENQPSTKEKNTLHSIMYSTWEYASSLALLYDIKEIKEKSEKLLKILYDHLDKSIHLLRLLQEMEINNDVDELKVFILLLHKLNYLNKDNLGFEYIEINIVDSTPISIGEPNEGDTSAKKYFDYINSAKKEKAYSMSNLVRCYSSSEQCKEKIREYSQYVKPIDDIND